MRLRCERVTADRRITLDAVLNEVELPLAGVRRDPINGVVKYGSPHCNHHIFLRGAGGELSLIAQVTGDDVGAPGFLAIG